MVFPRQEYWSGIPCPSPGDLPNPGMEPMSPALTGEVFTTKPTGKPRKAYSETKNNVKMGTKRGKGTPEAGSFLESICHPGDWNLDFSWL